MKSGAVHHIDDMKKGWFIGDFKPTLLPTRDVEVAVKRYKKNDYEESHFHKISTEFTVIIDGRVRMLGSEYKSGDIVIIPPGVETDFLALSDVTTVVVKHPGANNDKYIV